MKTGYIYPLCEPATPENLLDNSNFCDPVNQRGVMSGTYTWQYGIDRWLVGTNVKTQVPMHLSKAGMTIGIGSTGIGRITQRIPSNQEGRTYSAFAKTSDGTLIAGNVGDYVTDSGFYQVELEFASETTLVWAAAYPGIYTAETLPPYIPKGYATELAECRRYYQHILRTAYCYAVSNNVGYYVIEDFPEMRIAPTVTASILHNGLGTNDYAPVANMMFKDRIDYISSRVLLKSYESAIYDCYLSADL